MNENRYRKMMLIAGRILRKYSDTELDFATIQMAQLELKKELRLNGYRESECQLIIGRDGRFDISLSMPTSLEEVRETE